MATNRSPLFKIVGKNGHEFGLFCTRDQAEARLAHLASFSRHAPFLSIREA